MTLAYLSSGNSIHTIKWVNAMVQRGHDVHLLTLHDADRAAIDPSVVIHRLPFSAPLGYFASALRVRRLLREIAPDLLHAHYASGYGTLGRLAGFHPLVLSVWGSDIYDFPYASPLHRALVRTNLKAADVLCSTSHVMARQTEKVWPEAGLIEVTPFGVSLDQFEVKNEAGAEEGLVTVGTVKTLAPKYGIDLLVRAFHRVREDVGASDPDQASRLRLRIVGGGPEREALQALVDQLGLSDVTTFEGAVPHTEVAGYLRALDVYVALSRLDSESFGVAIIEASASAVPVVVSDVGGLPEVVADGQTGVVVPREDVEAAAVAIKRLVLDPGARREMGRAGRRLVEERYSWSRCVDVMEEVYISVLADSDPQRRRSIAGTTDD